MNCPYCSKKAEFISSKEFYGRDYKSNLYLCRDCNAYVGTHGKGTRPLGTMANKKLRALRKACHLEFDKKWRGRRNARKKRTAAYQWLQDTMKLPSKEAHIAMFDEEKCFRLLKILQDEKQKNHQ